MTVEQLQNLLDDTGCVIVYGKGRDNDLEIDPDEREPDETIISVEDELDGKDYNFTLQSLLEAEVSADGKILCTKDQHGEVQDLKFMSEEQMDLRPYFGIETEKRMDIVVHTISYDIDNVGTELEVFGDEESAWRFAADLAVENADSRIAKEVEKLRDLHEYQKCVKRWQKDIDDCGIGYITVVSQPVKGGITVPRGDVTVQQDGDIVVIEPSAGKWLDVSQLIPGRIVARVKESTA